MRVIKRVPRGLVITLSLFAFILVGFKGCVYSHHLSFIPKGIGVWWITYSKEESWGFWSGGNETGVIVYLLPAASAEKVKAGGIDYLSTLKPEFMPNGRNRWNGIYEQWKSTPLTFHDPSSDTERGSDTAIPNIDYYLDKYGFGISIDSEVKKEINKAISEPGNFYAGGRSGIIIVAPSMRRIFYVYAG